jgi:hypothetical protein
MRFLSRVGRLFPRNETVDSVKTVVRFNASPEAVWQGMLFYEEVPRRPTPLLRMFLPLPLRTEGDKTRVGATIACTYESGYLEKRITAAEPGRFVRFDVLVQDLGIEDCISMGEGSYDIRSETEGSEVVLTTRYRGHLRPRWMWRPFERFLAHRLHHHILDGMRVTLEAPVPEVRALPAERVGERRAPVGLVPLEPLVAPRAP